MGDPLAYFLTWTTYGTWLHGDRRGSVDRMNACHGMEYHAPAHVWRRDSKARLKHPVKVLSDGERELVEAAIRDHCAFRDWRLIAVNCRSNHVHVIVTATGIPPERVMMQLKAYATRALRGHTEANTGRVWTRGGSTRYIQSEASLDSAVQYVKFQ